MCQAIVYLDGEKVMEDVIWVEPSTWRTTATPTEAQTREAMNLLDRLCRLRRDGHGDTYVT